MTLNSKVIIIWVCSFTVMVFNHPASPPEHHSSSATGSRNSWKLATCQFKPAPLLSSAPLSQLCANLPIWLIYLSIRFLSKELGVKYPGLDGPLGTTSGRADSASGGMSDELSAFVADLTGQC